MAAAVRTLLLDNYDSFTFNLFQALAEVNDAEPIVVRNDAASGWDALRGLDVDNVVISPGPGRPDRPGDFGVCAAAILAADVPLLGVCLGHQGIGHLAGARVVAAPDVMHGRLSRIHHDGSPLFAGIPQDFEAVRYHSLCVETPLPAGLRALAWAPDGVLMALAHRTRPLWGVQFHPESVCSEHGRRLLANFRDLTVAAGRGRRGVGPPRRAPSAAAARGRVRALVDRLDGPLDTERAFMTLFGDEPEAFWLDSARAAAGSRFSFMGAPGGPRSATITYDVATREVRVRRGEALEVHRETIFEHLDRELAGMPRLPELPFEFDGGFVGYFGYELKADCDGDAAHGSSLPDAAFFFADRLVAYDHAERGTYLVALTDAAGSSAARRWIHETRRRLAAVPPLPPVPRAATGKPPEPVEFRLSRSRERYREDIRRSQDYLRQGESYEVCLTNRITTTAAPDPLALYRTLRRVNPAPFAAFLRFGDAAVLCSSPERFLRIGRDRRAEAKPIKGTVRRGCTPAEDAWLAEALRTSEKNRAENLMITDLLRNDLGSVCEVGSVTVSRLMAIESFETVHQLVSTIAGRLREDVGPAACVRACFPGGSMTGAPKQRTMSIIDALEGEARGVYSGAIGYLGAGGGADLNIVIRTVVMDGRCTSIGAGGAIVMQSDPEQELDEMLLKAEAPMRAIALQVSGAPCWRLLDPDEPLGAPTRPREADSPAAELTGGAV